jgi:LPS sulfotransferase NodH
MNSDKSVEGVVVNHGPGSETTTSGYTRGPQFDELPLKDSAQQRFVIFSSQRTGSSYLCRRLCNVAGRFGVPSEYLNPESIREMAPRLTGIDPETQKVDIRAYLRAIERARTTDDGWFGLKVQPQQLMAVMGRQLEVLFRYLDGFDRVVLMTRSDKLGQAISGAIAQATGSWLSLGEEPRIDEQALDRMIPMVARNLSRYIDEEQLILAAGRAVNKPVLHIDYTEIERDGDAAFRSLLAFLSAGESADVTEDDTVVIPKKPAGVIAGKLRERFMTFLNDPAVFEQS